MCEDRKKIKLEKYGKERKGRQKKRKKETDRKKERKKEISVTVTMKSRELSGNNESPT